MDMERCCLVENGGIRIPVGYRFLPTNEELLVHYLRPKVLAIPFPASVIPEYDVFQTDPWGLPGDLNKDRYFFSNHSKTGGKCKRAAGSGYWKPTGKCKLIVVPQTNHPTVGIRTTLVFTQNKSPQTRWFMHQFCFVGPPTTQVLDWAVYRLFQKKRKQKKQKGEVKSIEEVSLRSGLVDEIDEAPQLSSCSSEVTDESALLDQEASGDVFPSFSCMRKQD